MDKIKLIIGLGNPGKDYENTRHNAGFLFIDELERYLKIENLKFKITAVKSQSFMNESGTAVLALMKQYHPTGDHPKGDKVKPENTLVVHDDIDILWGNFKFSFGRSSAGHKGVESIIKALKTKNFWRLRIGIQPNQSESGKRPASAKAMAGKQATRIRADKIILKKFTPRELAELNKTIKNAISELEIA